jgi:hypothetical protein
MATLVMTTILAPSMTDARTVNARELRDHAVMAIFARLICVIQQLFNDIGPTVTVLVAAMAILAPWETHVLVVASPTSLAAKIILVCCCFDKVALEFLE